MLTKPIWYIRPSEIKPGPEPVKTALETLPFRKLNHILSKTKITKRPDRQEQVSSHIVR